MTLIGDAPAKPWAVWQTEYCPLWCDTKHHDSDHPEDRDHIGHFQSLPLVKAPAVDYGEHGGGWKLAELRIYIRQPQGGEAFVHLVTDDIQRAGICIDLSDGEANELAMLLAQAHEFIEAAAR